MFDPEGNKKQYDCINRPTFYAYTKLSELSYQQDSPHFGAILKCAIVSLMFNTAQVGIVPLMALAPKYSFPNTAIDVLGPKLLVIEIFKDMAVTCCFYYKSKKNMRSTTGVQ